MTTLKQVWQVFKENGCDVSVHRTVQAKLGTDSDAPSVQAFLDELEEFLADQEMLLLMLSIGLGGLYETQASFLGILLREEVLQPRMVDMLLEKVGYFRIALERGVRLLLFYLACIDPTHDCLVWWPSIVVLAFRILG